MAQATVSIRMDAELKNQMEKLCDELGMNLTTAFTIFAKKATRDRRIPFEVSVDCPDERMKELDRRIARLDAGLGHEHELIEVEN